MSRRSSARAVVGLVVCLLGCGPSTPSGVALGGDSEDAGSDLPDSPLDPKFDAGSNLDAGSTSDAASDDVPFDAGQEPDAEPSDDGGSGGDAGEPSICSVQTACTSPVYPCVELLPSGYTCDGLHAEWPMPSTAPGAKVVTSYDTESVELVTIDNVTGLWWERAPAGTTSGWAEAQAYCADLALGGAEDWRLPNMIELVSIVDETAVDAPLIDQAAFPDTPGAGFWSAALPSSSAALVVAFDRDWTYRSEELTVKRYARCVRGGPEGPFSPKDRYVVDATGGTVTDTRTGLVWERSVGDELVYSDAEAHCAALGDGFRVPTYKELFTLVDRSRSMPAIDPVFDNTPTEPFWSSVTNFGSDLFMHAVSFEEGQPGALNRAYPFHVRCVR